MFSDFAHFFVKACSVGSSIYAIMVSWINEEKMKKPEEIRGFEGQYEFLSNFYICPMNMNINNIVFHFGSSEVAYQMFKIFKDWENPTQEELLRALAFVSDCPTPGRAKRKGRKIEVDAEYWDSAKKDVMYEILKAKFQNLVLKEKLLKTEDAYLEETNTWNDTYWGVCNGKGQNILGKLLMRLRSDIRNTHV